MVLKVFTGYPRNSSGTTIWCRKKKMNYFCLSVLSLVLHLVLMNHKDSSVGWRQILVPKCLNGFESFWRKILSVYLLSWERGKKEQSLDDENLCSCTLSTLYVLRRTISYPDILFSVCASWTSSHGRILYLWHRRQCWQGVKGECFSSHWW